MTTAAKSLIEGPAYAIGGPTGYDEVVGFSKVLPALKPLDDLAHPDLLLFQTLHIMPELCWYTMHHEIRRAAAALSDGSYTRAVKFLDRAVHLQRMTVDQIDCLRETIPQADFLGIRATLPGNDSGLDSPGAKNLHRVARHLWLVFEAAMARHGARPVDLMSREVAEAAPADGEISGLASVARKLMELDDALLDWQQVHQRLVWSRVGGHPNFRETPSEEGGPLTATGKSGRPVDLLDKFAVRLHFAELWRAAQIVSMRESASY
ncbi:hypothetical protein [Kitasatospora sp. NPDC088783]|uniref:hypothetical protein n=1 Tax=Kitasatospora sp. NPDC088783 TaxID=3364077 RepID=UPI00380AAC56